MHQRRGPGGSSDEAGAHSNRPLRNASGRQSRRGGSKAGTEANGQIVERVSNLMLAPTAYSAVR